MYKLLASTVLAIVMTHPASAQISVPVNTMSFDNAMGVVMNPCSGGRCAAKRSAPSNAPSGRVPARPGQASSAVLPTGTYQPTADLAQRASQAVVARVRKSNPDQAAQLARELQRIDYRQSYASAVRADGFRTDSLSDVMAAYAMLGWMIVNDQTHTDRSQATGLRRQFASRIAANPQALSRRGELAEETKILFVSLYSGMMSAQRKGKQRVYAQAVDRLMQQQFGLQLSRLNLTQTGFVER